ncbi:acetyltransferase [Acinetobacter haemolyticus]|uniref:acetyltransferase n=1 Tax=Acinetobacter haemolyticus TaxID=29430 RepID=UPI003F5774A4
MINPNPKVIYAVYGSSGFGRGVMPLARQQLAAQLHTDDYELVFIDDSNTESLVNGHKVYNFDQFLALKCEQKYIAVAIANSQIREKLVNKIDIAKLRHWSIQASTVISMDDVLIGEGAILCNHVHFTSNIRIGRFFHANYYSYIAHDCVIGDYVTFAPGVKCNGNIHIEDHAYIGTGAVIKQGTPDKPLVIGKGAVVGMGAVVTKSVPAGVTVVGNPARILEKK